VHATAAGRIYLAFDPSLVKLPREPFTSFTKKTPTTARALDAHVARVREAGFDANVDEWVPGLAVVSAPIVQAGRIAGVLACAMPTAHYEDGASLVTERVRHAASRIGKKLEGKVT
jgi:DNA-binding IclR family transcriptional regulator